MGKKSKEAVKANQPSKELNYVPGWFGGRLTTPAAQRATSEMSEWMKARVIAHSKTAKKLPPENETQTHFKM